MADAMRNEYLDAMGIQRWQLRDRVVTADEDVIVDAVRLDKPKVDEPKVDEAKVDEIRTNKIRLDEDGLAPVEIAKPDQSQPQLQPVDAGIAPDGSSVQRQKQWARLQSQVAQCSACDLHQQRMQPVFGVGDQQAQCLVISDAPGVEEDKLGEPIVGPAGTLFNGMLRAIGLSRKTAYITNIIKCHSPDNRALRSEELASCSGYLQQQIAMIQPAVILVTGKVAAQTLLESMENVGSLRGKVHDYGEQKIPLVVTYHPAYLLRKPLEKRKAWADLQLAQGVMQTALTVEQA